MLEEISPLDYILATRLSKSLGEIRAMPNAEIVEWSVYLEYEAEMTKLHSR
jgi:hypothetical protein